VWAWSRRDCKARADRELLNRLARAFSERPATWVTGARGGRYLEEIPDLKLPAEMKEMAT